MPNPSPSETADRRETFDRRRLVRGALRWVEHGLALFGALVLLFLLTLDVSVIVSTSMSPTLQMANYRNGDHILTEKVTKWFRGPRRWEVITYINEDGRLFVKRVVGLPGETVQLSRDMHLMINGEPVESPDALDRQYLRFGNLVSGQAVACGDGYFVLGDDTKDSDDSRFNGTVTSDRIVGRAWLIISPLSRFGFVNR